MDRDSLRLLLAQGMSVEKIAVRFGKNPSTVSYWMRKHGLEAPNREKYAAKGGIDKGELQEFVERGMTIAEIADEVGLSKTTVRHWLRHYELRTLATRDIHARRRARAEGLLAATFVCPQHGQVEYILEGRGYYRCKRCRQERVTQRRRDVKLVLVAEAGGACLLCGYCRYAGALAFHHLDPALKRISVSADGYGYSVERLRAEAAKCVLLCANCHAEVEGGLASVPVESQTPRPARG